jgi:FkbM family methyltransferase
MKKAMSELDSANQSFQVGNLDEAYRFCVQAVEAEPENAKAYAFWGKVCQDQINYEEALKHYVKASELAPEIAKYRYQIADILLLQGQYQQAETYYRPLLESELSQNPWLFCNLGRSLLYQNKFDEASVYLHRAIELAPDLAEAHVSLGRVLTKQHRFAEATSYYQKAIELNPSNFLDYHELGDNYLLQKEYEAAIVAYKTAIDLHPSYFWSHHNLGKAFSKVGKWEEAIAACQKAIKIKSDFPETHCNLGKALSKQERWKEAIVAYKNAIELEPKRVDLYRLLGEIQEKIGNLAGQLETYLQLIELEPQQSEWLYLTVGRLLIDERQLEKAFLILQQAILLYPHNSGLFRALGIVHLNSGNSEGAIYSYKKTIQLDPQEPQWVYSTLARLLVEKNSLDDAAFVYQKLIKHYPDDAKALEFLKLNSNRIKVDILITPNEVNSRHGTGILLKKIFKNSPNLLSIRSQNHYGGEHDLGDPQICLSHTECSRLQVFSNVLEAIKDHRPNRILCIPYFRDDVLTAIAIKEICNVPLCTYIMDDNNIHSSGISDELLAELLQKSTVRLAISPELQQAYQKKYNQKFWLLPPITSDELIFDGDESFFKQERSPHIGILVGNVWNQKWLDLLRNTIRDSGIELHWYCNSNSPWLNFDKSELEKDGIFLRDPLPETELAPLLLNYSFTLLPSGTLDAADEMKSVASLSLPSRIPFILAASNTPIIVLGSPDTAASRFVKRFQVGVTSAYTSQDLRQAVSLVASPENQEQMRRNAASIAHHFSDRGRADWIWQALDRGEPIDRVFELLMPPFEKDIPHYVDPPTPKEVYWSFNPDYQVMLRLKQRGYYPDFVIDVGASTGIWSDTVNKVYPNARFILFEPILSKHDAIARKYYIESHANFEVLEMAVSNELSQTFFHVSADLYGSSLLNPEDAREYDSVPVEITTLDHIAKQKQILGRGFLKIDVQCAEHLVLEGAKNFLSQVDGILIELSLIRFDEHAKTFKEMVDLLFSLGYHYYDEGGCWRSGIHGALLQKDVVFVRPGLFGKN